MISPKCTLPAILLLALPACTPPAVKEGTPPPVHTMHHLTGPDGAELGEAKAVAIDSNHGIHMLGEFAGVLAWGTSRLGEASEDGDAERDVYMASLDEDGVLQRLHMIDCTTRAQAVAIAADKNNNIYIMVNHLSPCLVDGYEVGYTSGSTGESFLASFAPDGTLRWLNRWEASVEGEAYMSDLSVNAAGQLVCIGEISGTVTLGSTDDHPVTRSSPTGPVLELAVYTESGAFVRGSEFPWANGQHIKVDTDPHNNILVSGSFGGTLTFGPHVLASPGAYDSFFAAKFSPSGVPLWAKSANGTGSSHGMDACFDLDSNCCIVGDFVASMEVEAMRVTARGSSDVYLLKYKPSGYLDGLFTFGSDGSDNGYGVCVGTNNQLLLTGNYAGTIGFSESDLTYPVDGLTDAYILNLNNALDDIAWFAHSTGEHSQAGNAIAADGDAIAVVGATEGTIRFGTTTFSPGGGMSSFAAITGY